MGRRAIGATLSAALVAGLGALLVIGRASSPGAVPQASSAASADPAASAASAASADPAAPAGPDAAIDPAQCQGRPLALPSGLPARLDCASTRHIVGQVRDKLAAPAKIPSPKAFGDAVIDWLDPHGLWSAPPDAPMRPQFRKLSAALLHEIELPVPDARGCTAASELGRSTARWVAELRRILEASRAEAREEPFDRAFDLAGEGVFADDSVTRPGRDLSRDLGLRIGVFARVWGDAEHATQLARERLLPDLGDQAWTGAVLAAALRAYVPLVDPHGQWAPLDEEWSLYASDPAVEAEPRLWGRMERTALGVRVIEDPAPPLLEGDLVLSVAGIATAGLSVEQVEQLSHLEVASESAQSVVVLRKGDPAPRSLAVELAQAGDLGELGPTDRPVPFANGEVAVVTIPDIPDDLGDGLERTVSRLAESPHPPLGILLDLRGNGGGSIDGAAQAIGVFLPGVPAFPLHRRDGGIEIEHAGVPAPAGRWTGPVAALVDGNTASAAEMIAGAISTYRRGPVVGSRTFGKGCVQEYFDDRVGSGVLRVTTMLFALPDGSALQGVGLDPWLPLELPAGTERERSIPGSLAPWRGPDVRSKAFMGGPDWPAHQGRVGPCEDREICAALKRLGSVATARLGVAGRRTRD